MRAFETAFLQRTADDELLAALTDSHRQFFEGTRAKAHTRDVIRESWLRVSRFGLTPAHGGLLEERVQGPRFSTEGEYANRLLAGIFPILRSQLEPLLDDDETLLVLADETGTVIDRAGGRAITTRAESLGLTPGGSWAERAVGTNAIGTALFTGAPVHVHAAEHFCFSHHVWSCAAAPVRDPRSGRVQGVIDLSFRARQAHPTAVALAASLARQSELALRDAHRRSLGKLRDRLSTKPECGSWLLVDDWGWIADGSMHVPGERVTLPESPDAPAVVDGVGVMALERVPGGWLLLDSVKERSEGISVILGNHRCEVVVTSNGHAWTHALVGRRAGIVRALAEHPAGLTAQQLSEAVYGERGSEVAVRAEIYRIRRETGELIATRPYRLGEGVEVVRPS